MTINKAKLYKTIGWTVVGIGFYLVGLGVIHDGEAETVYSKPRNTDSNIFDAEFTIIDD